MAPNNSDQPRKCNGDQVQTETFAQKLQKRLARRATTKKYLGAAKAQPQQNNIFRVSEVRESDKLARSFGVMAMDCSNEKDATDLKQGLQNMSLKRRAEEADLEMQDAAEQKRAKSSG